MTSSLLGVACFSRSTLLITVGIYLLLKDKPHQFDASLMIKVLKEINLLPPRANEMVTRVKTNKFGDVMCAKYKSVTPRLSIDGVRAVPEQVKVVSLKEKKRAPPSIFKE